MNENYRRLVSRMDGAGRAVERAEKGDEIRQQHRESTKKMYDAAQRPDLMKREQIVNDDAAFFFSVANNIRFLGK
jgi:hypothetical protein